MAKTDRERAIVMMRRHGFGLFPITAFDDELLQGLEAGVDVEVTFKQRRSIPQLRRYWVMLQEVVKATECNPSAAHLHDAIKLATGYTTVIKTLSGDSFVVPDSVAFSRMSADEFRGFFDRAVRLLGETYGIDPLALEKIAA